MEAIHEIGYPAIARAQQLSAERLGVRGSERASRWDITRPQQPSAGDNCNGDTGTENPEGSRGRRQEATAESVAAAMRSSLPPPPATARQGASGGDLRRDNKWDTDKFPSPLPPRHARPAQRTVLVDVTQILRGVREEAVALDRFLSLEVEPAAQHIFDAAASEHAKAYRLSAGPPPAADFGIDPMSSNSNSNSSTPTTATNTTNDDEDTGGVAAAAAARRRPPDAGRRVLKAQSIKQHPPPEFNLRASLPARAGAAGGAVDAFVRRLNTALVGRGAGGGGGGGDKSRLSLSGRHYRYPTSGIAGRPGRNKQGGGAGAGVERKALVATADIDGRCNGRAGDSGARAGWRREAGADDAGSRNICVGKEEEGEEDEGEWEVLRLPDGQLATDISSKMVGLSSLIRNKAAGASGEAGRNGHHVHRQLRGR